MRTLTTRLTLPLFAVLLVAALPLFAQDTQNDLTGGTIIVEQKSELDAVGDWTMLQPNQESFKRTDKQLTMPDMLPGKYTFLANAPNGTSTHIDLFLGDEVLATSETPQITFDLADKMTLRIAVSYTLTISGKVGVNSIPSGVPFVLVGPNSMTKKGVTPAEFSPFPIGNYSVTYRPDGCPQPPAQSGLLQKDDRVNFNVEIVCKSFRPVETDNAPEHISTKIGGETLTFTDVPYDSWFAPYVATVTKRGVMGGYTDMNGVSTGKFGPGDPVTVAQLAKIAHTALKLNENEFMSAPQNPLARGQWFTRYIASAEERGWLIYLDGSIDPNRPATRAEVVTTLLQLFDVPAKWPTGTVFTDVLRKTPYSGAIETAAAEKIVSGSTGPDGKPTGLFHPSEQITRAEISKILITVYEKYQAASSSSAGR